MMNSEQGISNFEVTRCLHFNIRDSLFEIRDLILFTVERNQFGQKSQSVSSSRCPSFSFLVRR